VRKPTVLYTYTPAQRANAEERYVMDRDDMLKYLDLHDKVFLFRSRLMRL
jgi:hypothetical protein